MAITIASCAQISVQEPLSQNWFTSPILHSERYVRAIDPDFKPFVPPVAARRMGLILKRAMATSYSALSQAGVPMPDAIITATGLGCIENTEKFLKHLSLQGESCLQPSFFINSTHNTIGSYIATQMKCHGYNNTYVHRAISFESALYDAMLQMDLGKIGTALVGAHDEMTPDYFRLLDRVGFWDGSFAAETALSFLVRNTGNEQDKVEIVGMDILYRPGDERLEESLTALCARKSLEVRDIDLLVTGRNGNAGNNRIYADFEKKYGLESRSESYKALFGESFTSSGYGLCYGFESLVRAESPLGRKVKNVLIYNHFKNIDHTLILLSLC